MEPSASAQVVRIQLTRGMFAIIDAIDLPIVSGRSWHAIPKKNGTKFYAASSQHPKRLMHREIMAATAGQLVDHRNNDGLDNRRSNLRIATFSQNNFNTKKYRGLSRFKGVSWHARSAKWAAYIQCRGDSKYLGLHVSEEDAARAYDSAARELFGEFARLNFEDQAIVA